MRHLAQAHASPGAVRASPRSDACVPWLRCRRHPARRHMAHSTNADVTRHEGIWHVPRMRTSLATKAYGTCRECGRHSPRRHMARAANADVTRHEGIWHVPRMRTSLATKAHVTWR